MDYLKHFRKSKLAILKTEYSENNPSWANCKCEDAARADKSYIEVLNGLKEATEISEAARYELEISRAAIQLYQTERADRRAELNII
ncbi:MAG: hypothetical protein GY931_00460 [Maribacter sp.]|nr:hypothetical protein [Maribacter sp.]